MPWNESTVYDQRVRFVLEVEQKTFSFAESCRRYGISRTAGYRWWNRYQELGLEALHDRSHRPHHCPHATPAEVEEHIVELRRRYGWGSRKLRKQVTEQLAEGRVPRPQGPRRNPAISLKGIGAPDAAHVSGSRSVGAGLD